LSVIVTTRGRPSLPPPGRMSLTPGL
jgi:hypothetical protein